MSSFFIQPFSQSCQIKNFSCGELALDNYLKNNASQDIKRGFSSVYVASIRSNPFNVIGFYTLSAASLSLSDLPWDVARKLPRYSTAPAILLGRLAVDREFQGKGIGTLLIVDALRRSLRTEIGWAFFLVDAKNEKVTSLYAKMNFESLADKPLHLWLSRKMANKFVSQA